MLQAQPARTGPAGTHACSGVWGHVGVKRECWRPSVVWGGVAPRACVVCEVEAVAVRRAGRRGRCETGAGACPNVGMTRERQEGDEW